MVGPVLEAVFSLHESFPQPRKFVGFLSPVKLLLFKKTDTFFYRSTPYLLDALGCRRNFIFPSLSIRKFGRVACSQAVRMVEKTGIRNKVAILDSRG